MKKDEYRKIYELEEKNWWFVGKRRIIFQFLKKFLKGKKRDKTRLRLLDIGCGTGIILKNFLRYGKAHGVDISEESIRFCVKRGLKNIKKAGAEKLPFKGNSFDVIGIFDVLYHKNIKDDVKVLKEINRILKPGGLLLLTDSANMDLWSRHDIMVEARERYSKKEMKKKVESAGLMIRKLSYFNFFLFPIVYTTRKLDNAINKGKRPKSNVEKTNIFFNFVLKNILYTESFLLKFVDFPFGVSIFCAATKKEQKHSK